MTALPLAATTVAARESGWYTLAEAAALLGRSEGQLRRLCPRMGANARKSRGQWMIHAAASPRLNRAAVERTESGGSAVVELLRSAPADKRAAAQTRASVLVEFRRWRSRPGVRVTAEIQTFCRAMERRHGIRPTRATLYAWDRRCPASEDFDGCVAALLDTRGRPPAGSARLSDAAWQYFCGLYLTRSQLSIAHCWEMTRARAAEEGWGWPSVRRVQQLVAERIDPGTIALRRHGAEAWERDHLAPIEQDPDAWAAGQCWEGDHTPFDFSVRIMRGGRWAAARPQLTAWLDRRSRRLMGWRISEQGNQGTIRLALLDALSRDGVSVPEVVWIDNGKDFMAASIGGLTKAQRRGMSAAERRDAESRCAGLLRMVGIEPHFAQPYNHNGKARIERFFRTMHERFDRLFATWCGSRPGMIDRRELNATLRDVMALPTIDDLREGFAQWAEWYNHRAAHEIDDLRDRQTRERLSPAEFYDRELPAVRTVDRRVLPLLGQVWSTRPLRVSKMGVTLEMAGGRVRYGEREPALEPLVGSGRGVYVSYDPADTGSVEVWDEAFRHLCTARENGRHGGLADDEVTVADRRAAFAQRREQRRRARERVDALSLSLSDAELASRRARQREIEQTQARMREAGHEDPPPIRIVRTPLDGADAERASQRQAAGGEVAGHADEIDLSALAPAPEPCRDDAEFDLGSAVFEAPAQDADDGLRPVFSPTHDRGDRDDASADDALEPRWDDGDDEGDHAHDLLMELL